MNATKQMRSQSTDHGSLSALVAGHPFLKGLGRQHLAILAERAMAVEFKKGELIFREGDPANRFYLIRQGRVELETEIKDRGRMLIQTIGPGDVLGWSWLFPPYYWHFDARAVSPVKAIFFYGTLLRQRCEEDHHLGYELMKRVAEVVIKRLQAARKYLIEIGQPGT
jgi:CRP/FNR family cyclic AMP-dependent transcriptional regulator